MTTNRFIYLMSFLLTLYLIYMLGFYDSGSWMDFNEEQYNPPYYPWN